MIPALTVSVALYLLSYRNPEHTLPLWLASASAIVAGLSKQPALLWLMAMFPILVAVDIVRRRRTLLTLLPVAIECSPVCSGSSPRALGSSTIRALSGIRSRAGTGLISCCSPRASTWAGDRGSWCCCCWAHTSAARTDRTHDLLRSDPPLAGLASARGGHVFAVSALLIAANDYWPSTARELSEAGTRVSARVRSFACAAMGIAARSRHRSMGSARGVPFSFYDGGKNTIYKYFGDDAAFVYREIYRDVLWIPSPYIYGVFYGHNAIIRPNHRAVKLDVKRIRADIVRDRPDYRMPATTSPTAPARHCFASSWRSARTGSRPSPNHPTDGYTVYRLDNDAGS